MVGRRRDRACAPAENLAKFSLAYRSAAVRFSCARGLGIRRGPCACARFTRSHLAQKREEAQPVQLPLHAAAAASFGGAGQRLAVIARPVQRRLHVVRAQRSDYRVHLCKRSLHREAGSARCIRRRRGATPTRLQLLRHHRACFGAVQLGDVEAAVAVQVSRDDLARAAGRARRRAGAAATRACAARTCCSVLSSKGRSHQARATSNEKCLSTVWRGNAFAAPSAPSKTQQCARCGCSQPRACVSRFAC